MSTHRMFGQKSSPKQIGRDRIGDLGCLVDLPCPELTFPGIAQLRSSKELLDQLSHLIPRRPGLR